MASSSSSSAFRFLGVLKQPEPDPNNAFPSEDLVESDVVWSSFSSDDTDSDPSPTLPNAASPPTPNLLASPTHLRLFSTGLSAALVEDHRPLVRRKYSNLNPSASAASAARTIPPVMKSEIPNSRFHQSAPVNVPVWPNKKVSGGTGRLDQFDELEEEDEEDLEEKEMVPPHVIVARSHVSFSVFEGVGRTLKGRDLRRVRNAVFQQTGFID